MIIIDAYNLQCSKAAEHLFGVKPSIRQICRWISEFLDDEVVLVLDGNKKPSEPQRDEFVSIKLKYSGQHMEADDVILKLLESKSDARGCRIEVVSDDKKVRRYARESRAKPIKCEEFIRRFAAKKRRRMTPRMADEPLEKTSGLSGGSDADVWLESLGLGEGKEQPPAPVPVRKTPGGKPPRDKAVEKQTLPKPEEVDMETIFRSL